jgi:hypothetical protein
VSLKLVSLKDIPHTYYCTYFIQNKKNKSGNKKGTLPVLNTEESKLYLNQIIILFGALFFVFYLFMYFIYFILFYFYMVNWHDG